MGRALDPESGDFVAGKVFKDQDGKLKCAINKHRTISGSFEILKKHSKFFWQTSSNGEVSPNAVVGGRRKKGENIYIGRTKFGENLIVGKVKKSKKEIYIINEGNEIPLKDFDVLVKLPDGE